MVINQSKEKTFYFFRIEKFFKKAFFVGTSLCFFGLSGCTGENTGQLLGGTMGALMGSQIGRGNGKIVATAIGAVAGMTLGGALGKTQDRKRAEEAARRAASTGQDVAWNSPSTGMGGTWKAGPVQYDQNYRPYRRLKCLATKPNGEPVNLYVNAYQGPDGNWYMD